MVNCTHVSGSTPTLNEDNHNELRIWSYFSDVAKVYASNAWEIHYQAFFPCKYYCNTFFCLFTHFSSCFTSLFTLVIALRQLRSAFSSHLEKIYQHWDEQENTRRRNKNQRNTLNYYKIQQRKLPDHSFTNLISN